MNDVGRQIGFGSLILSSCVVVHVAILGVGTDFLQVFGLFGPAAQSYRHWITLLLSACGVVLLGQTAQVWIWALILRARGALDDMGEAVYFALVTTTTLGYGDVVLDRRFRVLGAMAAVSGLITYGLSTAFLVSVAAGLATPAP